MSETTITTEKLDEILVYLKRAEGRDRLRLVGSFIRGIFAFLPFILVLWSMWYLYANKESILQFMTSQVVKQTSQMIPSAGTQNISSDVIKQLMNGNR